MKVYKKEISKKNRLLALKVTGVLSAIPLTIAVAKDVFGINLEIVNINTNIAIDFINTVYDSMYNWGSNIMYTLSLLIGIQLYANVETSLDVRKLKKQKYFLENKDEILKGLETTTILDASNFKMKQLEAYADKGRSKVLR